MSLGKLSFSQLVFSTKPESCGIHNFIGAFSAVKLNNPFEHVAVKITHPTMKNQGFLVIMMPSLKGVDKKK